MQKKYKVSIIYVNYKSEPELIKSISSIKESSVRKKYEIIVVDNSGKTSTKVNLKKKFPEVLYKKSPGNIGYGAGNNLGAKISQGEYLFILNPDTKVFPGTIDKLVSFLDKNKKAAAVAPNYVDTKRKLFAQLGTRELTPVRGVFAFSFLNKLFPNNSHSKAYWANDLPKDVLRKLDTIPGSAFMIRKNAFLKAGMFDEKLFMYFEEADLGRRLAALGYAQYITPEAEVLHYWKGRSNSNRSKKLERIFKKSRLYYFFKHYGLMKAVLVEIFARLGKYEAIFILILIASIFLRFYKIEELAVINGEIGHNLLEIKNYYINKEISLIGPPTSHPWLSFGPLYYWLYGTFLVLTKFNPLSHSYFGAFISVLTVIANYFTITSIFNKKIGISSTFFVAISPYFVNYGRESRFFSLILLLIYPFIYFLYRALKKNRRSTFWMGLFYGLMFSFHFSQLILLPTILLMLFLHSRNSKIKTFIKFFCGAIISNIPYIFYNFTHKFHMLKDLLLWLPYRLLGFLHILPKNNTTSEVISANVTSFYTYIYKSIVPNNSLFAFFIVILLILFFFRILKDSTKISELRWKIISLMLIFSFIAIFIHGDPPEHYFMPIFFIPPLLLAGFINYVWKNSLGKLFGIGIIIGVFIINLQFYLSSEQFMKNESTYGYISYSTKKYIADTIVNDSADSPFALRREGPLDEFEGDFAQDYQYLMWWKGNEPVKVGNTVVKNEEPLIQYTIYEKSDNVLINENILTKDHNIVVTKETWKKY